MEFVSITEARKQLPSLVDAEGVRTISRHGRPVAVLMSYDAYEAMRADLELLRDPEGLLQIERDHERFTAGGPGGLPEYDPETGELRYETGPMRDVAGEVRESAPARSAGDLGPSPRESIGLDPARLSALLERIEGRLSRLEARIAGRGETPGDQLSGE